MITLGTLSGPSIQVSSSVQGIRKNSSIRTCNTGHAFSRLVYIWCAPEPTLEISNSANKSLIFYLLVTIPETGAGIGFDCGSSVRVGT